MKTKKGRTKWTLATWTAEGTRRFGNDQSKWLFVCPACGNQQSIEDFRPFKDQGATPEDARFNCIGRFIGPKREAFGGDGPGPCDFTAGGLLNISPWTVKKPDGNALSSFAFAEIPTPAKSRCKKSSSKS